MLCFIIMSFTFHTFKCCIFVNLIHQPQVTIVVYRYCSNIFPSEGEICPKFGCILLTFTIVLLTLIPVWIIICINHNVWDEITIHSQTSTVAPLDLGKNSQFHSAIYWRCNYLSMLRLKLIHVSNRGTWSKGQMPVWAYPSPSSHVTLGLWVGLFYKTCYTKSDGL